MKVVLSRLPVYSIAFFMREPKRFLLMNMIEYDWMIGKWKIQFSKKLSNYGPKLIQKTFMH